jgi:hypothetical protein
LMSGIYSGKISGVSQTDILKLVKLLKQAFDESDEETNLSQYAEEWMRIENYTKKDLSIAFMRALTLLLLNFFSVLPAPLVSPNYFSRISEIVSHLRKLVSDKAFGESVNDIPVHLLSKLVNPLLQQLPECNYQTLKKIMQHLHKVYADCKSDKLLKQTSFTWSGALFGVSNLNIFETQVKVTDERVFFVELLIARYNVLFPVGSETQKFLEPQKKAAVEQVVENVFPIDVHVEVNPSTTERISKRIPTNTLVFHVVSMILEELKKYSDSFSGFKLYECMDGEMERVIDLDESIFAVVTGWATPLGHKLVFKRSYYDLSASINPFTLSGWILKEGVGHKTWKKRFFSLKHDFLYYYKDERCNIQSLVGKLNYRGMGIYIMSETDWNSKRPTQFCICLKSKDGRDATPRRLLCFETKNDMRMWVSALSEASKRKDAVDENSKPPIASLPSPALSQFNGPTLQVNAGNGFYSNGLTLPSLPKSPM